MAKTKVSIVKKDDVYEQVLHAINLLGGIERFVKKGQRVLLKPNVTGPAPADRGVTTTPSLLEAVTRLVHDAGAGKITIADGTGSATIGTIKVFEMSGYNYIKDKYPVEFFDLNRDKIVEVPVKQPYILDKIRMAKSVFEEYDVIINLPVMKTHFLTGISCAIKNLKGLIPPSEKRLMHDIGVNKAVADLCSLIEPTLTVVDGTVASEGLGPKEGNPVGMGVVVAGTDVVAVDAVCAAVMGFDVREFEHITLVHDRGKGVIDLEDIEIAGDSIASVMKKFKPAIPTIPEGKKFNIINGSACSGCISAAVISASRLTESGIIDALDKKGINLTYAVGPEFDKNQEWPAAENLFFLGNCAKKMSDKGQYFPGCAPASIFINAMLAEYYGFDPETLETAIGDVDKK